MYSSSFDPAKSEFLFDKKIRFRINEQSEDSGQVYHQASMLSQKSVVSQRDIKKNNDFMNLKQKYLGPSSIINTEQQVNKEKLEQQKEMVRELKKKQKFKTIKGF